jgi:hypothetical protein
LNSDFLQVSRGVDSSGFPKTLNITFTYNGTEYKINMEKDKKSKEADVFVSEHKKISKKDLKVCRYLQVNKLMLQNKKVNYFFRMMQSFFIIHHQTNKQLLP